MPKILYRGAESIIYLDNDSIVKERIKKSYRISEIDEKLRKERTRKEVKLLMDARARGIMTPKIVHVDEQDNKIVMEHVEGRRVKELLESSDESTIAKICQNIGKVVGKLHANDIIHGDLTTSNMISNNDIYLIDFSLGDISRKIEDKGTDLKLLKDTIKSTHFKIFKTCWDNIVKGYRGEYADAEKILEKVEDIERRARYREHE